MQNSNNATRSQAKTMPNPALGGALDSPRGANLTDVPEDSVLSPQAKGTGTGAPRSTSPYIHPSLSNSASTFKNVAATASTSSLVSGVGARTPAGPRNPSALRTSSASSIYTLDPGISAPSTPGPMPNAPAPPGAATPSTSSGSKKKRSKSPMNEKRGKSKGLEKKVSASSEGDDKDDKDGEGSGKDGKEGGTPVKEGLNKNGKPVKVVLPGMTTHLRQRHTPHLPSGHIEVAPATLMYWSRAPVYGYVPPHGLRAHTANLVDHIIWIYGGCDEKGCWRDFWCLNTETLQWTHPGVQGEIPPPCRAHTATLVDRRLVVFGGGEGPVYRNDVYVFDTVTRRWQRPVFPEDMELPPARRAHTAVLYKNKVWVFGGGNGAQALNDLWTLDVGVPIEKMKWTRMHMKGKAPLARGYHTANLVGNVMVIMGGSDGKECFSDIWCLNLDTLVWSMVKLDTTHRRLSHTATQVGSYLFIWGGHDGSQYTEELLLFNLVSLNYETRPIAGRKPVPRGYHAATLADSRLWIFGGFNGAQVFEDCYILDLAGAAYLPQVTSFTIDVE
ncbi:galactose oxidase [Panus rudis PR-1116 ss-1]|nr:galactose oxidase [Panus rudis PR-1116 ss-1]